MAQKSLKKSSSGPSPLTSHHRKPGRPVGLDFLRELTSSSHVHVPAKQSQPKRQGAVKHRTIQQRLQGQTIADIERQMAVRAGAVGKLTIMKSMDAAPAAKPGTGGSSSKKAAKKKQGKK
ncbi:hypothetical protein RI367_004646 [Sorochytrium milnesiophthora]